MKEIIISIKGNEQESQISLIINNEVRMIEEITTYFEPDKTKLKQTLFKTSLNREMYTDNVCDECMLIYFNSQLNALVEYYKTKGIYTISIK